MSGGVSKAYPEVFTTVPAPVAEKKPGQLSQDQIRHFFEQGYVVVKDVFTEEELQPCKDIIDASVDTLAHKLYNGGKIDKLYEEYGLFQRLAELEKVFPGASTLWFKDTKLSKPFQDLWSNYKMLNICEQVLGPDVAGFPNWNPRANLPNFAGTTVPWHQDSSYYSEGSEDHMILTGWIPFEDTSAYNGGMQMMKGSHRKGKIARHTLGYGDTWLVSISEDDMKETLGVDPKTDTITCEVPFGGMVLFSNVLAHRSLPNQSDAIRWSVDLRWQSPKKDWGFFDIVEGITFRLADQPDLKPDWEKFMSVNRKEVYQKRHYKKVLDADPFDTIVTGPWFPRWEVVKGNRHTEAFKQYTM